MRQHVCPVCWSTPGVGLVGSKLRHLVFSHVSAIPRGLRLAQPSQLLATLGFFGHRVSLLQLTWWRGLGLQPFPSFSGLLLLRLLAGVVEVLHPGAPVAVVSAWFAGEVTLLPFPYLRVSMPLACGVSGVCGLCCRSRLPFVVRHGLGFVDACSGCWLVLVPAVFWTPPWALPSRFQVGCWLEVVGVSPSLSSLRSFAVEGVDMVLCQVLVGLPSWCCCASGLRGPVVFLLFQLGRFSLVRSGRCSSSVHDRGVAFPPLVGLAFGISTVLLPQADAVGFGLCWSALLTALLMGRCYSFALDSSSLAWLKGEPSTVFLLLCLPSGCGHPLGSLVSSVTIDRQRRFPWVEFFSLVW